MWEGEVVIKDLPTTAVYVLLLSWFPLRFTTSFEKWSPFKLAVAAILTEESAHVTFILHIFALFVYGCVTLQYSHSWLRPENTFLLL